MFDDAAGEQSLLFEPGELGVHLLRARLPEEAGEPRETAGEFVSRKLFHIELGKKRATETHPPILPAATAIGYHKCGAGTNHREIACWRGVRGRGIVSPMPKQVSNVATDDYLTTIYRLHHDEGLDVIAIRLADRLEITPPSVAGMLKRLQRDGLVDIDGKKLIHLTPEGLARAEEMVRRHRLAECLLTDVLKLEWWRAYEEAHLLEHGISDVTEPRLYEMLGRPQKSPFGYPIPGPGEAPVLSMTTLADLREGANVVVDRVFEEDEQLLRFFDDEGIRPGVGAVLESVAPYRGTITARIGERTVVMGTQVAGRIWVRPPDSSG